MELRVLQAPEECFVCSKRHVPPTPRAPEVRIVYSKGTFPNTPGAAAAATRFGQLRIKKDDNYIKSAFKRELFSPVKIVVAGR